MRGALIAALCLWGAVTRATAVETVRLPEIPPAPEAVASPLPVLSAAPPLAPAAPAPPASSEAPAALQGARFDGSRLPRGARGVSAVVVRSAQDLSGLPHEPPAEPLLRRLRREAGRMAPYRVLVYRDSRDGRFAAVDLSEKPHLIERFPEQESHEIALIKKLQRRAKELQILLRETGATPDVLVDGVVTELKTLMTRALKIKNIVKRANAQVREHAKRHGLGPGAAALDLLEYDSVPVETVQTELASFGRERRGRVYLSKVVVFAGDDMRVFARQDGRYVLEDEPAPAEPPRRTPRARDLRLLRRLLREGLIARAERLLAELQAPPAGEADHPLARARRLIDEKRRAGRLERLRRRGQLPAGV